MKRLKYCTSINPLLPRDRIPLSNDKVSFLPMERIGEDGAIDLSEMRTAYEVSKDYTAILDGDLVIAKISPCFENGKGALCYGLKSGIGFGTTELIVLRAKPHCNPRFLYWLTRSYEFRKWGEADMRGSAGQKRVTEEFVSNFRAIELSLPEQYRIAAYLDTETRKIDRLMDMRRRQMALLEEQRAALIQQAVTRGLNPNTPMKGSGLPWLGEIPTHWHCAQLRRFWMVIDCKHLTVPFCDEGYPLASVSEVQSFDLDLSQAKLTSKEFWRQLIEGGRQPQPGDLIYCRNTSVGAAAYVSSDDAIAMGQDVCLIRSLRQNNRYLNYLLRSGFMTEQLNTILVGATFKRINVADIKALVVLCPPKSEQYDIVEFIENKTAKFDAVHAAYSRQLILLAEYRTALINECVTGQRTVSEAIV